ncbi:glycosyltransferase [Arthrobacter sp. Bz4]|uniref:glycosyltransferase n=1 Tax=Arthrobacter sp. Bz4 TaxID=2171979 RepID=UPI000D50974F|nr:glycosyltransferase [Arthrobacter sp. Bz4]PVE15864.1 hypothetical protein DDA93_13460 [Arthrobacter sp. Bz4]
MTSGLHSYEIKNKKILVVGHDLKFAHAIIHQLQADGYQVDIDRWESHTRHDEVQSMSLLRKADVIFCEWALGNSVWYSKNKHPSQRLVVRVHSQELFQPHLGLLNMAAVDCFIFVGKYTEQLAKRKFGIPPSKSQVIPNSVDLGELAYSKLSSSRWNIGMVGAVPQNKRLDKALDVLEALRIREPRFQLFVKGKSPKDLPWMMTRKKEVSFYDDQRARVEVSPLLQNAVTFEPHGDDMSDWYTKIGVVISLSDFESFHLTLADGAASGAVATSLNWPGADLIYPGSWISPDISSMVEQILSKTSTEHVWRESAAQCKQFASESFDEQIIFPIFKNAILGD